MKLTNLKTRAVLFATLLLAMASPTARASIAYGSINNFDTVNDTGHECHGFEIELDDCRSTDLSYTFDYNHYGTPNITQDDSIPGHPKCIIRWASKKNADGTWAAYTAIPSGPISPTNGHMFTNPSVNFGGEHFGVGYNVPVTAVRYNWLIDDGSGTLIHGGAVQVSTPSFTYYPPVFVGNPAPAQVLAEIKPPEPAEPAVKEFGDAVWVKEIRTTSHNNNEVKLRDLVSDDPDKADEKNWKNGEADEVEVEWEILQKDYGKADGGVNNKHAAAAQDLPGGDEVVTRRYEFYKYVGPLDAESGEAMADQVAADKLHGAGIKTINGVEVDLSEVVVVGDYTGAQMAAVDVDAPVGLIDHVAEGKIETAYAARTLVVEGATPFTCTREGNLPNGMTFDAVTGVLSGTPTESGEFSFKITAVDTTNPPIAKNYTLVVAAQNALLAAESTVDTTVSPIGSGSTTGDGSFPTGDTVTVTASPNVGFHFVNWTDNGVVVNTNTSHSLTLDINHSLIANFAADVVQHSITTEASPLDGGSTSGGGIADEGSTANLLATPAQGFAFVNWTEGGTIVSTSSTYTFSVASDRSIVANFAPVPTYSITTNASPTAGGTTSGAGSYSSGTSATVVATANPGYTFVNWTVSGNQVSTTTSYTFNVTGNKTVVANFVLAGAAKTISTNSNPTAGGTTTGSGSYLTGESVTVVAIPNPGYIFSRWVEGNSNVSTTATYTFTATANHTLTARFTPVFVITTLSTPAEGGTTETDSANYKSGENAKLRAFPNDGYHFVNWTENGTIVSADSSYSFNVTVNRTIVANFESDTGVTISTNASPDIGGSVTGGGDYNIGDEVFLSAIPEAGYVFSNWTENGAIVSTESDYHFTAQNNGMFVANFVPAITITANATPAEGGIVTGAGDYANGATVTLDAAPNAGFKFIGWNENGNVISTSASLSFIATEARLLEAQFSPAYTITTAEWPIGAGTALGGGTVDGGTSITIVAAATEGYTFQSWTDENGIEVSTDPSYTFTPTADGTYTANFFTGLTGVHFNFDSGIPSLPLHTALPLTQTVAGVTASFTSPNELPPTIETEASTGYTLSKFSSHFISPSATAGTVIEIHFDVPVSGIAFNFATVEDPAAVAGSNIFLAATDTTSGVPVTIGSGLAHGTTTPGDSFPSGTMTFNADSPFDTVRIELSTFPEGAQKLLIDNLVASLSGSTGGSMMLANPNWNITLSDFGYSDYLIDNTPGFEGREYLSGEWGSAISYTKDGVDVPVTWLDPNFLYPDWKTNSDFKVVQGIHLVGANADGLPIAESVIANQDLEITLHFEMIDTVVGTPMGTTPASAASAPVSVDSNRYVLNQTFHVKNISGASITNVQISQLLHGLTSQHGSYDNRTYAGRMPEYHYDTTLAGIDGGAIGASSSSAGLEDIIAFHSKVAPTAFEIGHYGVAGNGIDNHSMGKPSDGVHLSIENNWQSAPYSTRQGTDSFAPADKWIAGGQRWTIGDLPAGQSTNFDIVLSLLTGTKVTTTDGGGGGGGNGGHSGGSCNGGSSHVGGVDFDFDNITSEGTFFGEFSDADEIEMTERENEGDFSLPTFQRPEGTSSTQLWNLKYNGSHSGLIHLTFAYDPNLLPAGFDESKLAIYHFNGTIWEKLPGTVDSVANKISATTTSLSPFALGVATGITVQLPAIGGTVTGSGFYQAGDSVTLAATPATGYWFTGWTENGLLVSNTPSYTFTMTGSRNLLAGFALNPVLQLTPSDPGTMILAWPASALGWNLEESTDLQSWSASVRAIIPVGDQNTVNVPTNNGSGYFRLAHP